MVHLISPERPTALLPLQSKDAPRESEVSLDTSNTVQCLAENTRHTTWGLAVTAMKKPPPNARPFGHGISVTYQLVS
jgi:hypothetical protein